VEDDLPLNRWLRLLICSKEMDELKFDLRSDSSLRENAMAVAALKQKPRLKTFHATVHVTRIEQWCVEAETAEEARELLAAGAGHRCEIGDCVNVEVEHVED
jgi:hypothetical protein